ncbi:MAG: hypothetical protein AB7S81_06270 [Bdellovibrionales bacterium]
MNENYQKPSYDEWMYWTQVILDRLTTVARVYANPPHPDVFIPIREKQEKTAAITDFIGRLHSLTDESESSMPQGEDAEAYTVQMADSLDALFRELLAKLPAISEDMQNLLKSPWFDNCAGKVANSIFRGTTSPQEESLEGIGSGMVEHGRLPAKMEELLDREATGETRAPRMEKPRYASPVMKRDELARLWGERNSAYLRSAGRIS